MKIGFYQPHLCLRGTTVAMFDYAWGNENILGNQSIIFYDKNNKHNNSETISKFSTFKMHAIENISELDSYIKKENCDAIYITKGGYKNDGRMATACKTLIHAIAPVPTTEKHGDVFAYGSYWLSEHCSNGALPAVPYMVSLPEINEDLRSILDIPKSAIVFGRNGGLDTWDLPFANDVLKKVLDKRKDIYFVFQNTNIPFLHERIKIIPSTPDLVFKTKFINTCDAMIHARYIGESFGLSCAEFSIRNKPIITYAGSPERNHIQILGSKGIYYNNAFEMYEKLINFQIQKATNWNCYQDYTPEKIMKIFKEVYLK